MDELPLTADDLLDVFDRADADAGVTSAALVDGTVLRSVVDDLLDSIAARDEWDLPARLFALAPIDQVERATGTHLAGRLRDLDPTLDDEQARELAEQLRSGLVVTGDHEHVTGALLEFPLDDGHPYDSLAGLQLPAWVGAAVLVSEVWVHLRDGVDGDAVAGIGADAVRRDDGAVEARSAFALTRLGAQLSALDVRGGGRQVHEADANAPDRSAGRIPGALARALDIPADPITRRPWLVLGGVWAERVCEAWPQRCDEVGPHATALEAQQLRPDVALATSALMWARLAQVCEQHGIDPADDDAVQALLTDGELDMDEAMQVPRLADLLSERPDPDDVDRLDRLTLEVTARAGWEGVRQACLPIAVPLGGVGVPAGLSLWVDGAMAMLHTELVVEDADASTALRQVGGLPRAPRWFRDSCRRFREAVEGLEVDPDPNPHLGG